jgi:hypothetical protein
MGLLKNLRLLRRSTPRNDKVGLFLVIASLAPRSRFKESRGHLKRHNRTFSTILIYLINKGNIFYILQNVKYVLIGVNFFFRLFVKIFSFLLRHKSKFEYGFFRLSKSPIIAAIHIVNFPLLYRFSLPEVSLTLFPKHLCLNIRYMKKVIACYDQGQRERN